MMVLDTNHLRELVLRTALGVRLEQRLRASKSNVVITVVSAEECFRGWLAKLGSARDVRDQVEGYRQLGLLLPFLARFTLLPWDDDAAQRFIGFRAAGIRIGTMDLKIACICIKHDAVLLTRNTVDFAGIPGLRFENWLD